MEQLTVPKYQVMLYLDGVLIGDIRKYARSLRWTRKRTRCGVDEIDFSISDVFFASWCEERGVTLEQMLRPLAVECRVVRDGVEVCGGFLATIPTYYPREASATLTMRFDGFLNLLDGVVLYPAATETAKMNEIIKGWVEMADARALSHGKAFGFTAGELDEMATVTQTYDNYQTIKHVICNRCDNVTGAGPFDMFFHADKTYDIIKDENFGDTITNYKITYPMRLSGVTASSLSADQVDGFASAVLAVGAGETSGDEQSDTAITSYQVDEDKVKKYGYCETVLQDSSVSTQSVLDNNAQSLLETTSSGVWQPKITLLGRFVAPTPTAPEGGYKMWLGDTVTVQNNADLTGMTNGEFRVNELFVQVDDSNAETITPTLARGNVSNPTTFATEIVKIKSELAALKVAR